MKKNLLLIPLIAFLVLFTSTANSQETTPMTTEAITVNHTGSFEINMTPDDALPLFTGPGEALWVPNWDPVILNGDGFEKGSVFQTTRDGGTTTWLVLKYDRNNHHARYMRMMPDYDVGTVDVTLKSNNNGGSVVTVTYQLTALGEDRNKSLAEWDADAYADEMLAWRDLIVAADDKIKAHFASR
ncbi:SRPBCC family protein [Pseudemcibacter aquimaris]|uniref:SRPBCC family protein n=1 Tax=Pseudemcibacter aquimaris TaxID=2857064 RepID=UPI00201344DC|nr:SRPBCC family protein [Pseudemcibacter aquimaris]MCC3860024.1 hypothetical protein [Pseudemcibacter aquimaris]WDU57354.1 hypothetical protein KW060_09100 [Pseudemcibacter aquimaris]